MRVCSRVVAYHKSILPKAPPSCDGGLASPADTLNRVSVSFSGSPEQLPCLDSSFLNPAVADSCSSLFLGFDPLCENQSCRLSKRLSQWLWHCPLTMLKCLLRSSLSYAILFLPACFSRQTLVRLNQYIPIENTDNQANVVFTKILESISKPMTGLYIIILCKEFPSVFLVCAIILSFNHLLLYQHKYLLVQPAFKINCIYIFHSV